MALLVLSFLNLWCAYHYFTAGRTLQSDLEQQHTPAAATPLTGASHG
jgi:hypothetical protein